MAKYTFSTYTASTNYISLLDDEPNDVGGLTAGEFKAKFDLSPTELKAFVNNSLIPAIQNHYATTSDIVAITQGAVADGSITEAKLAFDVATQAELDAYIASINGTASTIISNLATHTASTSFQHFNMMTVSGSIVQMGASTPSVLLPGGARKNLSINSTNDLIVHTDSLQSLLTTRGSVVIAGSAYTPLGLALGTNGKALVSDGTDVVWGYPDGTAYSASDTVILTSNTEVAITGIVDTANIWRTMKNFTVKKSGSVRVKCECKASSNVGTNLVGYDANTKASGFGSNYSAAQWDMNVNAGQTYSIQMNAGNANNVELYLRNLTICASEVVFNANSIT